MLHSSQILAPFTFLSESVKIEKSINRIKTMPKTTTTKKSTNTKTNHKAAKKTAVTTKRVATKSPKDSGKQEAYFWGGLGIILCATGALLTLLWGIGTMLNK
jgi:hypothetical protein